MSYAQLSVEARRQVEDLLNERKLAGLPPLTDDQVKEMVDDTIVRLADEQDETLRLKDMMSGYCDHPVDTGWSIVEGN